MQFIDCSYGEGGGQIIRTALAISTLTSKPFEADNIRIGREQPGLKAQHLHCIKALEKLCNAKAEHAALGSKKLIYVPGKIKGGTVEIDIGTAGSVSLLLQALLLPSFFAGKRTKLIITGGTDGKWAMPYEYLKYIFAPHLTKFVDKFDLKLLKRGYYPKGGGKIELTIKPKFRLSDFDSFEEFHDAMLLSKNKINLAARGKLLQIRGISHASKSLETSKVADRQAKIAQMALSKLNCPVNIDVQYCDTLSPGSGITLWATFSETDELDLNNPVILGSDILGERGKTSEAVGQEAAEQLIKEISSGAAVDSHLADNLIPFLALFSGSMHVSEITEHTKTNIWIAEQFLGKVVKVDEASSIISAFL